MRASANFNDAFGFHTSAQVERLSESFSKEESKTVAKGLNIRKILSYIPIVSTIIGIAMFIINRNLGSSSFKTGLGFRNFLDLFYLVPLTFLLDMIMSIGRAIAHRKAQQTEGVVAV